MSIANIKYDYNSVPESVRLRQKISHAPELIHQLNCAISGLPNLNEASYIWPETEDQYAIKEELEEELISEVQKLADYMPVLEKRIKQYNQNLGHIQDDSKKLNNQEPREYYSQAQEAQKKKCTEAVYDKDAISIILTEAKAVLEISRKKKFPGRKPVRQFPFPGAKSGDPPHSGQSCGPQAQSEKPHDHVAGLISMGPLK